MFGTMVRLIPVILIINQISVGSVKEDSLKEIWNNEKYNILRSNHLNKKDASTIHVIDVQLQIKKRKSNRHHRF